MTSHAPVGGPRILASRSFARAHAGGNVKDERRPSSAPGECGTRQRRDDGQHEGDLQGEEPMFPQPAHGQACRIEGTRLSPEIQVGHGTTRTGDPLTCDEQQHRDERQQEERVRVQKLHVVAVRRAW